MQWRLIAVAAILLAAPVHGGGSSHCTKAATDALEVTSCAPERAAMEETFLITIAAEVSAGVLSSVDDASTWTYRGCTHAATLDSQASATTYSALIEVNLTRPICTISGTVTSQVGLNTLHTVRFHLATYDEPSHESLVAQNGGGGIFAGIFWMIWAIYFLITNAIRDPYFRIFASLLGFGMLFMTRHPDYVLILGIAQAAATLYQVVRLMVPGLEIRR